jgi:hypothetical protein
VSRDFGLQTNQPPQSPGVNAPLIDLYNVFLAQTGEPAAAAKLAIGAAGQAQPRPGKIYRWPLVEEQAHKRKEESLVVRRDRATR